MKRLFSILATAGLFVAGTNTVSAKVVAAAAILQDAAPEAEKGFTQVLKEMFIQGGAGFMGIVLLCLILGLAVAIERIIYLNLATTNTTNGRCFGFRWY
jgi:biopolymer transport protein ExbB